MIEISHKQEPWYVFIAPSFVEEDRLQISLLVRWGEQSIASVDPMTGEQKIEYQYHAAKVTHSIQWPVSDFDIASVLEAARPELEYRAQIAECLEEIHNEA